MTPAQFRKLALAVPDAVEGAHMGHADFRIGGKIFASLGFPDAGWGMVKIAPEVQNVLVAAEPAAFEPAAGAWGRWGCTLVRLAKVDGVTMCGALAAAHRQMTAPKPARKPARKRAARKRATNRA